MTDESSYMCEVSLHEDLVLGDAFPEAEVMALGPFVEAVMAKLALESPLTVSLYLTTDEEIRQMNNEYRGVDASTDILSFAADPLPPEIADEEPPYLGDLIMAYNYTVQQAQSADNAPHDEFRLLLIHGLLHLTGHTHDDEEAQAVMWAQQAELLAAFNIQIEVPDYVHGRDDHSMEDDAQ